MILPNALTASELETKVLQLAGVTLARVELVDDRTEQPEVFIHYIERHLKVMANLHNS